MPKRSSKWSQQQSQTLRHLKQDQIKADIVDWELIAKIMNEKFPNYFRTSKQCREKYINHIVMERMDDLYEDWTCEQLRILWDMYLQYGPMWSLISKRLIRRSQNSIKNKFNTCLRKAANILYNSQTTKKNITYKILCSMINFTNQLRRRIQEMQLTQNKQSNFFIFRQEILKLCFFSQQYEEKSQFELITLIKYLNTKIRTYGAFRTTSKRREKFSDKGFMAICKKQNIVVEWIPKTKQLSYSQENKEISEFQESNIQNYQSLEHFQFEQMLQCYKNDQKTQHELNSLNKQVNQIIGYNEQKCIEHAFSNGL